jgi:hypothetical protein
LPVERIRAAVVGAGTAESIGEEIEDIVGEVEIAALADAARMPDTPYESDGTRTGFPPVEQAVTTTTTSPDQPLSGRSPSLDIHSLRRSLPTTATSRPLESHSAQVAASLSKHTMSTKSAA